MQLTLTQRDIDLIEQEIHQKIAKKLRMSLDLEKGQALEGDFISLIVTQVVLPILVSLASSGLYDVLKGEAKSSIRKMTGKKVNIENPLTSECMQELKTQLIPLGFTEEEIVRIYEESKIILHRPIKDS